MKQPSENPYLDGKRAFLEQHATIVHAAHQWRLISFGCIAGFIVATSGLVAVSLQHKVVPFVVEMNEHSEVVRVTRADEMARPTVNQIKSALTNWIIGARSVWGDYRAQEYMIRKTYAITLPDSSAYAALATYHKENDPFKRSQKEGVEVAVNNVSLIAGDTWRIEWTETTKGVNGRVIDVKTWQGSFTVVVVPPVNEGQILVNPLGVQVKDFTWVTRL